MKRRHVRLLLLIVLALGAVMGFLCYRKYQEQFIRLGDVRYEKNAQELHLPGGLPEDLEPLKQFPDLKQLDLRGSGISEQEYERVRQLLPATEILWDIPFQGAYYDMSTDRLTITELTEQDLPLLAYFGKLQQIDANSCEDYAMLAELRNQYPQLKVDYKIRIGEETFDYGAEQLVLLDADMDQVERTFPFFERLESVTFDGILPESQRLTALRAQYPNVEFYWQVDIFDVPADIHTTELDISGKTITSTEELEALVAYLPNLTKVLMLDCGLSNEQMAQLNERHPDVLFVWNVKLGRGLTVRSDITVFAPVKLYRKVYEGDLDNLRYCTELVVIDLGHMSISDVSFLEYTPEVRFLILADTRVTDLTPLSGLKKLQFLELFISPIRDYSPLLGCTALEDLNISGTYADPAPLMEMTWLKRLWHVMHYMTPEQRDALIEALPNTQVQWPTHGSTGGGWRDGALYFEMRDLMGMPYMEG